MNPFALILGLMAVGGMAGTLGRGRGRKTSDDEPSQEIGDQGDGISGTNTGDQGDGPSGTNTGDPVATDTNIPGAVSTPKPINLNPKPPLQTGGTETNGGEIAPTPLQSAPVEVMSGRVTTLAPEDDAIASIRIVNGPAHGNVSVNPDNTLALVLTGQTHTGEDALSYEIVRTDGTTETVTVNLNVLPSIQAAGWGAGEFYALRTDANGDSIIETGEIHRKVFVTGSDDGLTLGDIARLEGTTLEEIGTRWERWLAEHPEYGATPETALSAEVGIGLWNQITDPNRTEATSNWLLFERGYEYGDIGRFMTRGMQGESELHPIHITAWGEGTTPVIHQRLNAYQDATENVVVTDLHLASSAQVLQGENYLFEDVIFSGEEANFQNGIAITIRDSAIIDAYRETPEKITDTGKWEPVSNRMSGLFAKANTGFLIEHTFIAQNGWAPDYRYDMSIEGGHPPSFYSHNLYIQRDNFDVTLRDNIVMLGPSTGLQFRSGGFIEDNVFIDNNMAFNIGSGGDRDGDGIHAGNYTLATDNVITSAAHREVENKQGYLARGVENIAPMTTLVDNIIAHLADPNNPDEFLEKSESNKTDALVTQFEPFFDDTIIYNWYNAKNPDVTANADELDGSILDQTTIQLFTQQLLGNPNATIEDLADVLRAQAAGALDNVIDADLIISFFQQGFGMTPDIRAEADVLRFVPHDLGDGIRWDNRLNWSTEDLPGTQDGDSVNLAGNWVGYGAMTTKIEDLDFGSGGRLSVTSGYLEVDGRIGVGERGAQLEIDRSGQVWIDGYGDNELLTVGIEGGRLANTGHFFGNADVTVSDNGQAILATGGAAFDQTADRTLAIEGDDVRVGYDGTAGGIGLVRLHDDGWLDFSTDEDGSLGTIEEFRSGAFGDSPDIRSGMHLGGATLNLDLTGFAGTDHRLISADALTGNFDALNVAGLGTRDAEILVDYATDTVTLRLIESGSGSAKIATVGSDVGDDEDAELWAALTTGHGVFDETMGPSDEDDYLDVA